MTTETELKQTMSDKAAEAKSMLAELKAQADKAPTDRRLQYESRLEDLEVKLKMLERRMAEMAREGGKALDRMKMHEAVDEIDAAIRQTAALLQ